MDFSQLGSRFWIFLIVTSLRHIGFLSYEFYRRSRNRSQPVVEIGTTHLVIFRALYVAVWVGALYTLGQERSSPVWFSLGMSLLITGSIIRLVGLRTLGRFYSSHIVIQPGHQLVQHGIYSVIRHPLLLGLILELLGMTVLSQRIWMWLAWTAALIVLLWWQRREDTLLRRCFGESAERYQAKVPAMNLLRGLGRKLRSA